MLHVVTCAALGCCGLARVTRCCAVVRREVNPVGGTRVCNGKCRAAVRVPECSTGWIRLRVETSFDSGLDGHGIRLSHGTWSNAHAASRAEKSQEIAAQRCLLRAHCASQERSRRHAPLRRAVLGLQRCLAPADAWYDQEYVRNGTVNCSCFVDVNQP